MYFPHLIGDMQKDGCLPHSCSTVTELLFSCPKVSVSNSAQIKDRLCIVNLEGRPLVFR